MPVLFILFAPCHDRSLSMGLVGYDLFRKSVFILLAGADHGATALRTTFA